MASELTQRLSGFRKDCEHKINELKIQQLDDAEEKLKVPKFYIARHDFAPHKSSALLGKVSQRIALYDR